MKNWIISDTHLGHFNIIKYCSRPFYNLKQMNKEIISRWNSKVCKNDVVYHLGDFAFGSVEQIKEFRSQLNGTIILIRGNHDRKIVAGMGFIIKENPITIGKFILSHYPMEEIPEGFTNIHGHIHHKDSFHGINVSAEKLWYEPEEFEIEQDLNKTIALELDEQ